MHFWAPDYRNTSSWGRGAWPGESSPQPRVQGRDIQAAVHTKEGPLGRSRAMEVACSDSAAGEVTALRMCTC